MSVITGSSVLIIKKFIEKVGLSANLPFDDQKTLYNDYSVLFHNDYYQLEVVLSSYYISFKLYSIEDGILELVYEETLEKCAEEDLLEILDRIVDNITPVSTKLNDVRFYISEMNDDTPPELVDILVDSVPEFAKDVESYSVAIAETSFKLEFEKEDWRSNVSVLLTEGENTVDTSDLEDIVLVAGEHILTLSVSDPIKEDEGTDYVFVINPQ